MRLTVYADPRQADHAVPGHPERPARVDACLDALAASGVEAGVTEPPAATPEELGRAHDPGYLNRLLRFCARGGGALDPDTGAGPHSMEVAARASGAVCLAVEAAFAGEIRSFCLVRPPGHHAGPGRAMGFCLVNHAAVGARHALARGLARRVAIVDVDVHHGNGTQDIFWEDPAVLYLSTHQFPWYPGTGDLAEDGGPGAEGTTVNVPLPAETGDETYLAATAGLAVPLLREFGPDLVILSAGFDAHARDPLGQMLVSAPGYRAMASLLVRAAEEVCEGRLVATLEGGYDLEGLASSFAATVQAMAKPEEVDVPHPGTGASGEALRQAIAHHGRRWNL